MSDLKPLVSEWKGVFVRGAVRLRAVSRAANSGEPAMSDLKPLVPKWKGRADCALWVGEHCVGTVAGRPDGLWVGETDVDYRICRTKAEAKAWVEARLYGDNDE